VVPISKTERAVRDGDDHLRCFQRAVATETCRVVTFKPRVLLSSVDETW
jgi:hypothetical protein